MKFKLLPLQLLFSLVVAAPAFAVTTVPQLEAICKSSDGVQVLQISRLSRSISGIKNLVENRITPTGTQRVLSATVRRSSENLKVFSGLGVGARRLMPKFLVKLTYGEPILNIALFDPNKPRVDFLVTYETKQLRGDAQQKRVSMECRYVPRLSVIRPR